MFKQYIYIYISRVNKKIGRSIDIGGNALLVCICIYIYTQNNAIAKANIFCISGALQTVTRLGKIPANFQRHIVPCAVPWY